MTKKKAAKKRPVRTPNLDDHLAQIQDVFRIEDDGAIVVDQGRGLFDDGPTPVVE